MSVFINLIFKLQSIGMFIALLSLIVLTPLTRLSAAVVYPAAVGNNDYYQCEVGTTPNVVSIAAGGYHTVVLKSNKTVVATGDWTYGQCDVEGWINILQVAAGGMHTLGVRANHAVRAVGDNTYKQCAVTGWTNIKAVAGGYWHSVGLHIDGTVVACGDNRYGQGNVSTWTNISAIAAGHWHTVGLRTDGTVVSTGDNADGQMNVGNWTNIKAIGVGHIHTVGLRTDGTVVATGDNSNNQCDVADWANIVAIAVGQWHTVGLKADGTVVATGDKYDGQCNVSGVRHGTAIAAGYNHTAILSSAAHFTITSTAGDNGKVEPSGRLAVASDATVALNAFPAAGYVVDTWAIDGDIVQEGGLSYSLNNVTYDASVSVSFKLSAQHWTVTPSSGAHGTISPNVAQTVANGSDITFTAAPDANYLVDSWSVDGTVAQQGGNSFTLANVVANHAVAVSFKLGSWTVTPSNGAHGTISPNVAQTVANGSDVTFTAAPDANYLVDSWSVDGTVAQQGGNSFTLANVVANHAVIVSFKLVSWTVTPSSGTHGSVSPNVAQTVANGSDVTFTATPEANYLIDNWSVDGVVAQQGGNNFTLTNVVANHSVAVSFKLVSWTVTPSSGDHGSISPNVAQTVAQGSDVTFTATPFDNYLVDNWLLDGVVVRQGGESFILSNVVADHTLAVTFKLRSWTVTATVGEHGSINPSGVQTVLHGSSVSFIASPQEGYLTANWLVDGIVVQQGGNDFVLSQVIDNITVSVTFELAQVNDVTLAITPGITLVGKPVTLTATATGIINAEYQFFRQVGNEWVSISDNSYSESSSMQWTTNEVGIEHFRVHVREAGSTAYFAADASVQVLAALSAVNLTVEPPSIFIGQEVLLSAAPAGGELVEYQFYYRTGVQWTSLTGGRYLRDNICRWTPQNTGNYIIRVNAREVGTTKYLPAEATLRVNLPLSGVSLTAQSPIVLISKSVVLNAVPQGGSNLEYQFFLKDGENWQSLSDDQFVSENIASFLPDAPGSYQFQVLVREVGAVDSYASEVSVAVNPALSELELSAEPSPVLQGREVTFTASAVGGAQVEYQFYRHLPTGWESLTGGKYLPSNECRWTPADAGTFLIRVNARELGSKSYMPAEMLLTVNPALSGVTLKSQAARVLIGKSILLNAIPVGGSNVEYQFYRKEGTVWVSLNDGQYIPDNRFDLLPTATGKIQFRVVAREQGTVTTFSGTVTVTVVSPLSKVTITALPAQAMVGETITLKAVPTGGASVQYQFYRRLAASWESLTGGKYLTSASCNWTPTEVGNYLIRVNAREVGSSTYFPAEVLVSVKLPLSGVLLSTQASPMVLGKSIILTANPQNGGNVEYQFYKKDGENWLSLTEGLFVSDNIYSWLPADAGNYTFRVQARDVGGTALFDAEASIQVNPALSSVSFIADPSPAMLGDVVSLTAEAAGGASLEYQFYYRSGTAWVSLTGGQYSPLNNCQWTPAAAGSYLLRVNVREVGTLTYLPTEIILTVDPPLSGVTLEAQSSSVLLGKSVILNAVPEGGGIVEYQFSRLDGVNSTSLDKNNSGQFANESSMSWIPSAPGSYRFKVLARSTGSTKEFDSEVVVTVLPVLSKVTLQAEPSSSRPSSAVILTASAVGGMAVEYQFYRRLATGWESLTAGKYLAANVCEWVPSTAGSYLIRVNAREVGSKVYFPAEVTVVVSDQLSGVSLTAQPNPCLFSNSITLQAAPQQGLMVEYQFYRWHESQWESLTDGQFVTSASCPYTPPVEGENRFRVTAREVGATQSYSAEVSVQVNRPLNAVSLAVRPSNVVQGNDITLIATAHGGGTIEYEFFLWNGSAWQSISGGVFSTAATCNWKANSVGEKMFRVKAREVGTTAIYTAEIIAMVT